MCFDICDANELLFDADLFDFAGLARAAAPGKDGD